MAARARWPGWCPPARLRPGARACWVPELRPHPLTCCFPDQPVAGGSWPTLSALIARPRWTLAVRLRTNRWVRVDLRGAGDQRVLAQPAGQNVDVGEVPCGGPVEQREELGPGEFFRGERRPGRGHRGGKVWVARSRPRRLGPGVSAADDHPAERAAVMDPLRSPVALAGSLAAASRASRAAETWPRSRAVKKPRSSVGRAVAPAARGPATSTADEREAARAQPQRADGAA